MQSPTAIESRSELKSFLAVMLKACNVDIVEVVKACLRIPVVPIHGIDGLREFGGGFLVDATTIDSYPGVVLSIGYSTEFYNLPVSLTIRPLPRKKILMGDFLISPSIRQYCTSRRLLEEVLGLKCCGVEKVNCHTANVAVGRQLSFNPSNSGDKLFCLSCFERIIWNL